MNDTATAGGATGASLIPSTTDAFTIAHLVVVAIFALLVIAAIVWGARLKRQRKAAERAIAEHNDTVHGETEATGPSPVTSEPVVEAQTPDRTVASEAKPLVAPPATPELSREIEAPASPTPPPTTPASTREDAPDPTPEPLADEPIAASAPMTAAPATEAASQPSAFTDPADAPVTTLKGLGPKLATRLGELGITTIGQVAALSDDEATRLDAQLGPFAGRMTRDRWIEQASFLAAGDRAGFEAVFGRL